MEAPNAPAPVFGEPTPLGLLGLAIGCAALTPVAFGILPKEPAAIAMTLKTAAWFCLLFGAGCQFLAGVMSLANKNTLGGTLLTTFSFNWVMNWWALDQLSQGKVPDATIVFAVDVAFIVLFLALTYAFAFYSKLLFVFLIDIDLLYALRITKHFVPTATTLGTGVGVLTVLLGGLAAYIAIAILLNGAANKIVLPIGGPLIAPKA
mgnify:CR=1 FL=1|jgi:succinate-acetate transporter protein